MLQRRNVIHYIKMEHSPTTTTAPPPPEGVAPAQKKANDDAAVVALPSVYYKDKKRKRALRAGDPDVWEVVKQLSKAFYDANPGIDRADKKACNHVCTLCWETLKVQPRGDTFVGTVATKHLVEKHPECKPAKILVAKQTKCRSAKVEMMASVGIHFTKQTNVKAAARDSDTPSPEKKQKTLESLRLDPKQKALAAQAYWVVYCK